MKSERIKNLKHIAFISVTSILFSYFIAYLSFDEDNIVRIISFALVLLLFNTVLSGLIKLGFYVFKKNSTFLGIFSYTFIALLIILSFAAYFSNNPKTPLEDTYSYKKTILNKNKKPIKAVGDISTEFLNKDNFYENYEFNYTIKFPENYKLNYGAGKHSLILAYNEELGSQINVTSGDNGLGHSFDSKESNKLIKDFYDNGKEYLIAPLIKKLEEDQGYYKVLFKKSELVNFHNKYFIRLDFLASKMINNELHPLVISDFITFHNKNNYHFYYECVGEKLTDQWQSTILKTMATVRISNTITS
jgi:hypothetical protein